MELFFEREAKRLEFVAERNCICSEEKKLLDEAKEISDIEVILVNEIFIIMW